jgi:hypothetical protein
VNGRKMEGVTVGPEEVNFSEQEEVRVSNPCSHGMEKRIYLLQHMHYL